jgi:hypothetical protein
LAALVEALPHPTLKELCLELRRSASSEGVRALAAALPSASPSLTTTLIVIAPCADAAAVEELRQAGASENCRISTAR